MSSDGAGRPSVLPVERLLGTMLVSGGPGGQLTVHKLSRVSEQGRAPGNILAENLILMNQLQEAKRRLAPMGLTFGNTVFSAKTGCFFKTPCLRQSLFEFSSRSTSLQVLPKAGRAGIQAECPCHEACDVPVSEASASTLVKHGG